MSEEKSKRRWYRFSLRTLILMITVCSALFGWIGAHYHRTKQLSAALNKIKGCGAHVYYDHQVDDSGQSIDGKSPPGPYLLRWLFGEYAFSEVGLVTYNSGKLLTHDDLEPITTLRTLKDLCLQGSGIDDAKLVYVRDLRQLRTIWLDRNDGITDAGLVNLSVLKELKCLRMWQVKINGSGLKYVQDLPKLEELMLAHTNCDDVGLVHIRRMTNLKKLNLWHTRITDAGLVNLAPLKNLEYLNLTETEITDNGLVHLQSLTNLKRLDVGLSYVTDTGREQLKKHLPNINIDPF